MKRAPKRTTDRPPIGAAIIDAIVMGSGYTTETVVADAPNP
ncbi:hypothetical protein [Embleya sp. NPDC001921]